MKTAAFVLGLAFAWRGAQAVANDDPPNDIPWPTRPLEWKDVNFISTSDTHGWLLGHQHDTWPEPNYSGDWGDFASFTSHMRDLADKKGVDLLLVDAGDHHDGSGLVSSSHDSAARADEIFAMVDYDVLTIGNHELYKYESAKWLYDNAKRWGGRYLTSNVNITVFDEQGKAVSRPIGARSAKFATRQGKQVTAFGIIFDFKTNDRNLTIQSPSLMAHEKWFLQDIEAAPDFFVLAGHMPGRYETAEWTPVFDAIRSRHPCVPIYIFGGHTHVRDCVQYDDRSIAIVPGRYMETVAFTSSDLPIDLHHSKPLTMARRYLDANRNTYKYHSNQSNHFDTDLGLNITATLYNLAAELKLSTTLGIVPHDLFLERYPFGHRRSVRTEWVNKVLPATIQDVNRPTDRLIIVQSGTLRFDIFAGPFNKNDELTVSPFDDSFRYVTLPVGLARRVVAEMNRAGTTKLIPDPPSNKEQEEDRVSMIYRRWLKEQRDWYESDAGLLESIEPGQMFFGDVEHLKGKRLGFVTKDACPGVGDDIEHIPVPFSDDQPDFIATSLPAGLGDEALIDVVVLEFSVDDFLTAIHVLDPASSLTWADMLPYATDIQTSSMWGLYAKKAWQNSS